MKHRFAAALFAASLLAGCTAVSTAQPSPPPVQEPAPAVQTPQPEEMTDTPPDELHPIC